MELTKKLPFIGIQGLAGTTAKTPVDIGRIKPRNVSNNRILPDINNGNKGAGAWAGYVKGWWIFSSRGRWEGGGASYWDCKPRDHEGV